MDGNGRWAKKRGLPRHLGHKAGCDRVTDIYEECLAQGLKVMSLYAFSTEKWNRPKDEIDHLFRYLEIFFKKEMPRMIKDGTQIRVSGDITRLPLRTQTVVNDAVEQTKDGKTFVFNICLNYGGKAELVRAMKLFASDVNEGMKDIDDINEETFEDYLYTKGVYWLDYATLSE